MPKPTRRTFLKSSAAASVLSAPPLFGQADSANQVEQKAHVGGGSTAKNDVLRIALVGCGGRGRGAGVQALRADADTRIVACADAFQTPINTFLNATASMKDIQGRVDVPPERQFVGLDSCEQLLDTVDVDVVLLASPPHFRPSQYRQVIEAGKHCFTEKPVAVDGPGIRETMAVNALAKQKNVSVVSGLCWRYETGMLQTIQKIREGSIGTPVSATSVRYMGHVGRPTPRDVSKTEFEHQLRNWYFYPWLSGDFCVEQFVHDIDMVCWAFDEYPTACVCTGGRETRTGEQFGHMFDHFAAQFYFDSGKTYAATTRQQNGCANPYYNKVVGTNGVASLMRYDIKDHQGKQLWRRKERITPMHQLEHDAMYAAIRAGKPLHNGDYMTQSTLAGILMREAAYTGRMITADQVLRSTKTVRPARYALDAEPPVESVAVPGATSLS